MDIKAIMVISSAVFLIFAVMGGDHIKTNWFEFGPLGKRTRVLLGLIGLILIFILIYFLLLPDLRMNNLSVKSTQTAFEITQTAFAISQTEFERTKTAFASTLSDTPTNADTPVLSPTLAATSTVTLTETPKPTLTWTASPLPTKTLHDGCISKFTWQAASIDSAALNEVKVKNNCLNLNNLGIVAASDGTVHLLVGPSRVKSAAGIYTNVGDESVVQFKVYVQDFYLSYADNPAYISFAIAPQDIPMASQGSARFKLQIKDTGSSPLVFFVLADTSQSAGTELGTQHYLYGHTYTIRFVLKGIFMEVYIDDVRINRTISIPDGPKVFYIGYNIPILAKADIQVKDITVDGVSP